MDILIHQIIQKSQKMHNREYRLDKFNIILSIVKKLAEKAQELTVSLTMEYSTDSGHAEIFSKFGNKITGFNETDWSNLISQCLTPLLSNGYNPSQKMAYSINQRSNIGPLRYKATV